MTSATAGCDPLRIAAPTAGVTDRVNGATLSGSGEVGKDGGKTLAQRGQGQTTQACNRVNRFLLYKLQRLRSMCKGLHTQHRQMPSVATAGTVVPERSS